MSFIYAMSDIHGYDEAFEEALQLVDLDSNERNKLILLGDYVNKGPNSKHVLYKIYQLSCRYPKQIIVLRGNHDEMFLQWLLDKDDTFLQKSALTTIRSFSPKKFLKKKSRKPKTIHLNRARKKILKKHQPLIDWMQTLLFYYETDTQIFVHAGILEDAESWKHQTPKEYFLEKRPPETGAFYKDIIAGHVNSAEVSDNKQYLGKVYWDKKSHYYIDGNAKLSGIIPVLKYNQKNKTYTSFQRDTTGKWSEYLIK